VGAKQKSKMTKQELISCVIPEQLVDQQQQKKEHLEELKKHGLKSTKNYVDKQQFYQELVDYSELRDRVYKEKYLPLFEQAVQQAKDNGEKIPTLKDSYWKQKWIEMKPQVTNSIGEKLKLIAERLATRPNFSGYSFKESFVSDALIGCLQYFDNFDVKKSNNPFAYFTQVCWFCFIRRIQLEKKQSVIKGKLMMNSTLDEFADYGDMDDTMNIGEEVRSSHTFVEIAYEQEKKEAAEREKRQQAKKQQKLESQSNLSNLFA
jgi:hypothetical protein